VANAYGTEIEKILSRTQSDYVREVFSDGTVSVAEFQETLQSMVACLKDQGVDAIIENTSAGVDHVTWPSTHDGSKAIESCSAKWDGGITEIYSASSQNPDNIPWVDLEAACLVQLELAPAGFKGEDLDELYSLSADKVHVADGVESDPVPAANPTPTLPGGVPLYDKRTKGCLQAPWKTMQEAAAK
jgi:hypothetical protein